MRETSQKRAVRNYRRRLRRRGMARFEVLGLETDRHLIRSLAKRLAASGPEAIRIRDVVVNTITDEKRKKGTILTALRRSPLVGANLALDRPVTSGRRIDL